MVEVVDRSITDKVATSTNLSALLDKKNKSEQGNTTNIVSDNKKTNKIMFIKMLEEKNN